MFNLFKNDFSTFSNEEITEINKDESPTHSLYSPFTQEEVDSFQKKVDLVTLNNIAPTSFSILNQEVSAVKFLGWAEVSTIKEEDGHIGSNNDQ